MKRPLKTWLTLGLTAAFVFAGGPGFAMRCNHVMKAGMDNSLFCLKRCRAEGAHLMEQSGASASMASESCMQFSYKTALPVVKAEPVPAARRVPPELGLWTAFVGPAPVAARLSAAKFPIPPGPHLAAGCRALPTPHGPPSA